MALAGFWRVAAGVGCTTGGGRYPKTLTKCELPSSGLMSASAGWCFSPLPRVVLRSIEWIAIVRDSLCEAVERAGPKLGPRSILEESVNGALQSFPNDLHLTVILTRPSIVVHRSIHSLSKQSARLASLFRKCSSGYSRPPR